MEISNILPTEERLDQNFSISKYKNKSKDLAQELISEINWDCSNKIKETIRYSMNIIHDLEKIRNEIIVRTAGFKKNIIEIQEAGYENGKKYIKEIQEEINILYKNKKDIEKMMLEITKDIEYFYENFKKTQEDVDKYIENIQKKRKEYLNIAENYIIM